MKSDSSSSHGLHQQRHQQQQQPGAVSYNDDESNYTVMVLQPAPGQPGSMLECAQLEVPNKPLRYLLLEEGLFWIRLSNSSSEPTVAKLEVDGLVMKSHFRLLPFGTHTVKSTRSAAESTPVPLAFRPSLDQLRPFTNLDDIDSMAGVLRLLFFQVRDASAQKWELKSKEPFGMVILRYGYARPFRDFFGLKEGETSRLSTSPMASSSALHTAAAVAASRTAAGDHHQQQHQEDSLPQYRSISEEKARRTLSPARSRDGDKGELNKEGAKTAAAVVSVSVAYPRGGSPAPTPTPTPEGRKAGMMIDLSGGGADHESASARRRAFQKLVLETSERQSQSQSHKKASDDSNHSDVDGNADADEGGEPKTSRETASPKSITGSRHVGGGLGGSLMVGSGAPPVVVPPLRFQQLFARGSSASPSRGLGSTCSDSAVRESGDRTQQQAVVARGSWGDRGENDDVTRSTTGTGATEQQQRPSAALHNGGRRIVIFNSPSDPRRQPSPSAPSREVENPTATTTSATVNAPPPALAINASRSEERAPITGTAKRVAPSNRSAMGAAAPTAAPTLTAPTVAPAVAHYSRSPQRGRTPTRTAVAPTRTAVASTAAAALTPAVTQMCTECRGIFFLEKAKWDIAYDKVHHRCEELEARHHRDELAARSSARLIRMQQMQQDDELLALEDQSGQERKTATRVTTSQQSTSTATGTAPVKQQKQRLLAAPPISSTAKKTTGTTRTAVVNSGKDRTVSAPKRRAFTPPAAGKGVGPKKATPPPSAAFAPPTTRRVAAPPAASAAKGTGKTSSSSSTTAATAKSTSRGVRGRIPGASGTEPLRRVQSAPTSRSGSAVGGATKKDPVPFSRSATAATRVPVPVASRSRSGGERNRGGMAIVPGMVPIPATTTATTAPTMASGSDPTAGPGSGGEQQRNRWSGEGHQDEHPSSTAVAAAVLDTVPVYPAEEESRQKHAHAPKREQTAAEVTSVAESKKPTAAIQQLSSDEFLNRAKMLVFSSGAAAAAAAGGGEQRSGTGAMLYQRAAAPPNPFAALHRRQDQPQQAHHRHHQQEGTATATGDDPTCATTASRTALDALLSAQQHSEIATHPPHHRRVAARNEHSTAREGATTVASGVVPGAAAVHEDGEGRRSTSSAASATGADSAAAASVGSRSSCGGRSSGCATAGGPLQGVKVRSSLSREYVEQFQLGGGEEGEGVDGDGGCDKLSDVMMSSPAPKLPFPTSAGGGRNVDFGGRRHLVPAGQLGLESTLTPQLNGRERKSGTVSCYSTYGTTNTNGDDHRRDLSVDGSMLRFSV